ncbi:MAG: hypothetical protein IPH03_03440 [Tetrasphaera sp.]|nr:hypothetical protein [Tetrasphaera sp.]
MTLDVGTLPEVPEEVELPPVPVPLADPDVLDEDEPVDDAFLSSLPPKADPIRANIAGTRKSASHHHPPIGRRYRRVSSTHRVWTSPS